MIVLSHTVLFWFWEQSYLNHLKWIWSCISFLGLPQQITTNLVDWNNRNLFSLSSGGQKSKIRSQQGHLPLTSLGANSSLPLAAFGGSSSLAWNCITPNTSYVFAQTSPLCLKSPSPFSYKTPVIGFRVHSKTQMTSILIVSAKILFPNAVTFTGMGVRSWTPTCGGHDSSHYRSVPSFSKF